jgi:predicted porin
MKKSLLALAVLGAFAGAASAQTNITIYGIADVGIQRTDTNAPGVNPTWSLSSGIRNGSRLGFKGSEDLGGGLSAIFTLENGFNIDDGSMAQGGPTANTRGTTRLFGRQAWVGLNSNTIGALKLGRQYTPMHIALDSIDPFGTGLAGNIENVFNAYGIRMDNAINYTTANYAGLSGTVAYGMGEQAGGGFAANRSIGASVGYNNGPINAVLAYHKAKPVAGATLATSPAVDARTITLGGTYDFRVVKAHAAFASNRGTPGFSTANGISGTSGFGIVGPAAAATNLKSRDYMLGVTAPVGAGKVMASWVRHDDRQATNTDADQYALGYAYDLSKRTNVYTSVARLNDKSPTNIDSNTFNVGIQHRF